MVSADDKLPIDAILPQLSAALSTNPTVLLRAEPGAGKTTRVPLALRDANWLERRRILMLEPRRLAARAAARRMAQSLGEEIGASVGYRVRLDSKVGPKTCIEVVTEGMLTRRLQSDPELAEIGVVIFDEFHERSLEGDLGLALVRDVQAALRPDLRVLIMSATLETGPLAQLLGGPPMISVEGRSYRVDIVYRPRDGDKRLEPTLASVIREALRAQDGSVLAFLPGEAEIRRTAALLSDLPHGIDVHPLYGALPPEAQDHAIRPSPEGRRKVVLATTIAESSLTIEGVRIVIDSGFKRAPRFDPSTGMTRLETVRISLASAAQRLGRAGRLGPGICYRLWSEAEECGFSAHDAPEILNADLAPFALDLAQWGVRDPARLDFLDPPPPAHWRRATQLLKDLDAISEQGAITDEGRAMARLPVHPRLAHMIAAGIQAGAGGLACDVAALLSERDVLRGSRDADLSLRIEALRAKERGTDRVRAAATQLKRIAHVKEDGCELSVLGCLLAHAYPDRIAQARGARGRFRFSGGGGGVLPETDSLAREPFLAVADTDGHPGDAKIFLAAPLTLAAIEDAFGSHIQTQNVIAWDRRSNAVLAQRQRTLGALILEEKPLADPDPHAIAQALLVGLRESGLDTLPWPEATRALRARVAFLQRSMPEAEFPDLSDDALGASMDAWLLPYLGGKARKADLSEADLRSALLALIPHPLARALDKLAPPSLQIPSGASVAIDYDGETPVIRARLQELFGWHDTPRIANGKIALRIELLSPAGRPVAVTQDLASFWRGGYQAVRSDLRGRYPKHLWPDDPFAASAPRPGKPR